MEFLVTNDDGIFSPGIRVLAEVAAEFGKVTVVAPEAERSGISHAITLSEPLRVREFEDGWFALNGTPADCVFIGIHHILKERPDFVLSGINRGPNLGYDVLYSGTVGGAMEGLIQGVPSCAFSLVCKDEYPFDAIRPYVRAILGEVVERGFPGGVLLNINIPSPKMGPFRGFKVTRIGKRFYSNDIIRRVDPRGLEYLWIGGTRVTMEEDPETDCGAVKAGYCSITPIRLDVMAYDVVEKLRNFEDLEPVFGKKAGVARFGAR